MLLKCLNYYEFERYGRLWKCDETLSTGEIYAVPDDLGKELLATGNFQDALSGVAPKDFEAAQAELEKSLRIVPIGNPVNDEPVQPVASSGAGMATETVTEPTDELETPADEPETEPATDRED